MADSSPEDDDLDLTEDLELTDSDEDTKNSGREHCKRPAEECINQEVKRQKRDIQSFAAAKISSEEANANKQSTSEQYDNGTRQQMEEHRVTNYRLEKEKKNLTMSYERQVEESINQEKKRPREEEKSLTAANSSFEKEKVNKKSSYQHYHNDTIGDLKGQLASARRQLEDRCVTIKHLEKEKNDLTLRLSKLAGANLTYINPNTADLSDENRPTKLAEDFSELYENELTDAFESLGSKDEREKTQIMLEILKKSYELCYDTSQAHINAVKNEFATLRMRYEQEEVVEKSEEKASSNTEQGVQSFHYKILTTQFEKLTKKQMKTVSDIRKYFESKLTESFLKESADLIVKNLSEDIQKNEFVKYIQTCLQICWSMCRHEPPVFIHFIKPETDTLLDTNVFRPYTNTGKFLDYVVWPPLYLYEGGPMLSKGIAQGRK